MARNKYPGYCRKCGKWIEPGYGHFERRNGRWYIHCVKCASGRTLTDNDPGVKWAKAQNRRAGDENNNYDN